MKISDLMKMGIRSLTRRKARTILTVLGVVIGSLFIVIMGAVGEGMDYNFKKQVEEYGSLSTITVYTWGDIYDDNNNWVGSQEQKLDDKLVEQIKEIKHVRAVSPVLRQNVTLTSGKYQGWAYIIAMDKDVFNEFEFPNLSMGEYPNEEDNSTIVFGSRMPYEFHDPTSWSWTPIPIDITKDKIGLKFDRYPVAKGKKEFQLPLKNIAKMEETNSSFDGETYMDLEYYKEIYTKYCNTLSLQDRKKALEEIQKYQEIRLNVDNINNVEGVQKKIQEMGFQSNSLMQYIKPMMKTSQTLRMILLFLGAVSMFVSAISIANTMVMSIYERTKEIGIMKVLGCHVTDVRKLFLFEAGMIGMVGGFIGIGLSYLAAYFINKYGEPIFGALMSAGNISGNMQGMTKFAIITLKLPIFAMAISISVGLLSGYFPARRATKIRAIEAMKSEG